MTSVNSKYIIALVVVLGLVGILKLTNPHKKFSTAGYWEAATFESVNAVPEEALRPGNTNGSVLMWASIGSADPLIIRALVERGADVNEADPIFSGTPLTGAAGYTANPEIIEELVKLGADIHKQVNNKETPLMIAAQYNTNAGIIDKLIELGANPEHRNAQGKNALELAIANNNHVAEQALLNYLD